MPTSLASCAGLGATLRDTAPPPVFFLGNYSVKFIYGVRSADTTPRLGNKYILSLLLPIIFTKTKKTLSTTHYQSIFLGFYQEK